MLGITNMPVCCSQFFQPEATIATTIATESLVSSQSFQASAVIYELLQEASADLVGPHVSAVDAVRALSRWGSHPP